MIKSAVYFGPFQTRHTGILVQNRFVGSHLAQWKTCVFYPYTVVNHGVLLKNNWIFVGPSVMARWQDE